MENIEEIIALKSKIVFYGISYHGFSSEMPDHNRLPEPSDVIKEILKTDIEPMQINPKFTTLQAIRDTDNI